MLINYSKQFCIIIPLICIVSAQADNPPPDLRKYLADILEKQNSITFSAKTAAGHNNLRITQKIFQQANPDGTRFMRIETSTSAGTTVFLENSEGRFELFPASREAVKRSFNEKSQMPDYDDSARYSFREGLWQKKKCLIITKSITPSDSLFSRFQGSVHSEISRNMSKAELREMFYNTFISTTVYYIACDNDFIYAREYFTRDGKLVQTTSYKEVDFYPEIDEQIFLIPPGYQIKTVGNVAELLSATTQISSKNAQKQIALKLVPRSNVSTRDVFRATLDRHASAIISTSSRVLFWGALGVLLTALVMKIRKKREIDRVNSDPV